jgi:hypothetical protein
MADWGELHWRAIDPAASAAGGPTALRESFGVQAGRSDHPAFAHVWDLGTLKGSAVRRAMIAHVQREAANFFGTPCLSYWTKNFSSTEEMLAWATSQAETIRKRAGDIDAEVLRRARAAGGDALAALAALTFRQHFGACELVVCGNQTFYFSKEISSGGFIQTVDVVYPAAPILLAMNPDLLRMQLEPIFEAVRLGQWHEPFAMHDLGSFPNATGQTYYQDMRIEETANLILLAAALRRHDPAFWDRSLPILTGWAKYLEQAGFYPEHQLCTDDFAGPLANNANLAVKSILALACLPEFRAEAEARMKRWLKEADAGDRTVLVFGDRSGWSLKYNFFFDRLLGLGLVPQAVIDRELAYYRTKAGPYGIPLDVRKAYTKSDWLLWVAALAGPKEREAIIGDVLKFYQESKSRVPASDFYDTQTGLQSGFQARPVMGAVFAPILTAEQKK